MAGFNAGRGERFAETALLPVMTRQVASPLGVLEPSHSRHRVGRGRPDEESRRRVTRISRAQPSPDSETGTPAAFIQGLQGQCPIASDGRGDNPISTGLVFVSKYFDFIDMSG